MAIRVTSADQQPDPLAASGPAASAAKLRQVLIGTAIGFVVLVAVYAAMQASRVGEVDVASDPGAYQRLSSGGGPAGVLRPGAPLPDMEVMSLDGSTARLSDFRGRPVWVNVWATWCPPCRAEMPDIEALHKELAPQGLAIVAISISESPATVRRFMETAGYAVPVYLSPDGKVGDVLKVNGLPTHYFVDRQGTIRDVRFGGMSQAAMRSKLARIL